MNASFAPKSITFDNLAAVAAAAKNKLVADGNLTVDMGELSDCNSSAICFLLDLMRAAQTENCNVDVLNVNLRLKKLIRLYQLDSVIAFADQA